MTENVNGATIHTLHCQECGSTEEEDVNGSYYSRCCNEIVAWGGTCGNGLCYHDGWSDDDDDDEDWCVNRDR